jgi:hypothetical protein
MGTGVKRQTTGNKRQGRMGIQVERQRRTGIGVKRQGRMGIGMKRLRGKTGFGAK